MFSLDTSPAPLFRWKAYFTFKHFSAYYLYAFLLFFTLAVLWAEFIHFNLILFCSLYDSVCHLFKQYFVLLVLWQPLQSSCRDGTGAWLQFSCTALLRGLNPSMALPAIIATNTVKTSGGQQPLQDFSWHSQQKKRETMRNDSIKRVKIRWCQIQICHLLLWWNGKLL